MTSNNDQVKNLIQIRKSLARGAKGDLSQNRAFLDFLKIQAEMTEQIEQTWAVVRDRMDQYGITKIDGDWGHILIAERKNFSGTPAPRFTKKVLDTAKVTAYYNLYKKLPDGIQLTTTKYLSKRIKAV